MLIILKLFKLKLLLFLPLILGLASFKKLLGLFALVIPGLIGFFKFCKPNLQSTFGGNYGSGIPHYSPGGVGYHPGHYKEPGPSFAAPVGFQNEGQYFSSAGHSGGGLTFKEDYTGPYQGYYNQYRSASTEKTKSILPDS